jgi:hypothetical protein
MDFQVEPILPGCDKQCSQERSRPVERAILEVLVQSM